MGGFTEEAKAWRDWLLRAAAGNPADLQIMYGPAGERRLRSSSSPGCLATRDPGPFESATRPCSNGSSMCTARSWTRCTSPRRLGIETDSVSWPLERALTNFVGQIWSEPDEGIWEVRGPRRQFTHSKVMAWLAMIGPSSRSNLRSRRSGRRVAADRARIHEDVCAQGFNRTRNTFTQFYGSEELDASLLMIPLVGFLPADDPRVIGTIEAIERELLWEGFLVRYPMQSGTERIDGLPAGEGYSSRVRSGWLTTMCFKGGETRRRPSSSA